MEKLALKILKTDPHNTTDLPLLAVNFDPQLVNLLRETKYFLSLGVEVPSEACSVFERSRTFRRHIGALELLVAVWNRIQRTILPVELPLVRQQIDDVRARLDEGLKTLDWNSPTIDKYLDEVKVCFLLRSGLLMLHCICIVFCMHTLSSPCNICSSFLLDM